MFVTLSGIGNLFLLNLKNHRASNEIALPFLPKNHTRQRREKTKRDEKEMAIAFLAS
jgi:hypothetical protein